MVSQKGLAQNEDSLAPSPARMADESRSLRSTTSGTPSSGCLYREVGRAHESISKGRGRTLREKNSQTVGGISRGVSLEDRHEGKRKIRTPTRATKLQTIKGEAEIARSDTKDERSTKLAGAKTGSRRSAAHTEKIFKRPEEASSTQKDDASPELYTLFLAHREKALRTGKYLGAHISAAGGAQNAPVNCLTVGGQAFAFFLKNQRRWKSPPISEESARGFKEKVQALCLDGPQHILPHGSYLINLANPDSTKRQISYDAFVDDLRRCEQLGIKRYVLHPGSTVGACGKSEGIRNVAVCLNEAIAMTQQVTILLENMAGQKNVLCSSFEDLRDIIQKVERKDRVGVCLDTCHLFAAGFDIRTPDGFETVMKKFDTVVGMNYLKGMHINDSKSDVASGLDRHEHLGKGFIGIAAFKFIMRHPSWFKNMPLIIETPEKEGNPQAVWRDEIETLYEFVDR